MGKEKAPRWISPMGDVARCNARTILSSRAQIASVEAVDSQEAGVRCPAFGRWSFRKVTNGEGHTSVGPKRAPTSWSIPATRPAQIALPRYALRQVKENRNLSGCDPSECKKSVFEKPSSVAYPRRFLMMVLVHPCQQRHLHLNRSLQSVPFLLQGCQSQNAAR